MITRKDNMILCGEPDPGAVAQLENCAQLVQKTVLCADHHKGYSVPIGGVLADPEMIAPAAVGYDIACGMKAVRLDASFDDVKSNIRQIMDDISNVISFGIGQVNGQKVEHELFDDPMWRKGPLKSHRQSAQNQLGTVGGGNHWVNVFADEQHRIWVGCHFGSRGLGHKMATYFFDKMGSADSLDAPPKMISCHSELGMEYIEVMNMAGRYAYAGRDWVCSRVARIVGGKELESVHLHHNFLFREEHDGVEMWVGRKGSTPAFPGQRALVGASMAEPCAILEGIDSDLSRELLYSTVHGAGRVMSRTQARGKRHWRTGDYLRNEDGTIKNPGVVSSEMMMTAVKEAGVVLRGGDVDESPHVYKRLPEVLAHHEGTVKVVHWLRPLGVAMAPRDIVDPYKD